MKKSKLYKIVKESVKEVLKEQNTIKDPRIINRSGNKQRKKEESLDTISKLISKSTEKDLNKWIKVIQTLGGDVSNISPNSNDEVLQIWQNLEVSNPQGNNPPNNLTGQIPIWVINGSSTCAEEELNNGWICSGGNTAVTDVWVGNIQFLSDGSFPCAPSGTPNTLSNFFTYINNLYGGLLNGAISSYATANNSGNIEGYSDRCPQCQEATVNSATSGPPVGTPQAGNNINLTTSGVGLSFIDDKSCEFGDFCTRTFMDNDWCRPPQDGGNGDICIGNQADTSVFAAIGVDNNTCTWEGCIDVPVDPGYVCSLYGSLCDAQGPLGTYIPSYQFTNSGCTAVEGCTNTTFLANLGGNYDPANNVDDGGCTLNDYCNDGTSPNTICNLSNGIFCDAIGTLITTYIDNIGETQNITWGTANNANCAPNGCADDGNDPNYPGRPPGAPSTGYTNGVLTSGGTEGFRPSNYTAGSTEDGSCIYDLDNDGTWDWDEEEGCTDPNALNYDPLATEDSGCIQPVPGCIDNGDITNNLAIQAWFDFTGYTNADFWTGTSDLGNVDYSVAPNPSTYPGVVSPQFSATANIDDGSCKYPKGCTDSNADNFDPAAVIDDGSCETLGCMEPTANNTCTNNCDTDDGSCTFTGCAEPAAAAGGAFDGDGNGVQTVLPTSTITLLPGSQYVGRALSVGLGDTNDGSCEFEGCLDNSYPNYICDVLVNIGYGYICTGISGPGTGTIDNIYGIGVDNGSCANTNVTGCMDSSPGVTGTVHDNQDVNGNGSYLALNYDPNATMPGDCHYTYCSDNEAYNYSPGPWTDQSVKDDSLCEYEGCADVSFPGGGVSEEIFVGQGMYYYNADNDGCQINPGFNSPPNGLFLTGDLSAGNTDCCGAFGCIDNGQQNQNFWSSNNLVTGNNYATILGIPLYPGPYPGGVTANNYDAMATIDDGSCHYPQGCTDPNAPNYNSSAIIDDGSCLGPLKCRKIQAQQCKPVLHASQDINILNVNCFEIGNNTPQIGDEFWHPNGVEYFPPPVITQGAPCPQGWDGQNHDPTYPPFGTPGNFDGEIRTDNCCDYKWIMGSSGWLLHPPGLLQFQCDEGHVKGPRRVNGVFRITSVDDSIGTNVVSRPEWSCNNNPPITIKPGDGGGLEPIKVPKTAMAEIKLSKKLRKSLKDFYTKK